MTEKENNSTSFGFGINEWVKELTKNSGINLFLTTELFENSNYKLENLNLLKRMGLPYFRTELFTKDDYLLDSNSVWKRFEINRYFVSLIKVDGLRKREVGLSQSEADSFIHTNITNNTKHILISECPEQPYNGVLLMRSKDNFYLEMVKGPMPDLISLSKKPDYVAVRNLQDLSTKFNFSDESLKMKMNSVIRLTQCYPGYYEFSLALNTKTNMLSPYFYEYSNKKCLFRDWQLVF